MRRIVFIAILVIFIIIMIPASVIASDNDYIIKDNHKIAIPLTYMPAKVINDLGEAGVFNNAEDLFIDGHDQIYVADTGNNRIVKMDSAGNVLGVYKGPEDKPLNLPQGIYVDDAGDMYVADTGNNRIAHMAPEGRFVEQFVKPKSSLIEEATFEPVKLYISPIGYIYVLNKTNYKGIMTIDADNDFKGYIGSTKVGFSFTQWIRMNVASKTQRNLLAKATAPPYSNIFIDDYGMICVTTINVNDGQIRKLNSVGNNIYASGKVLNFGDIPKDDSGAIITDKEGKALPKRFVDLAVDKNGIISALEAGGCIIYQYDQDGNLLTSFGGNGDWKGRFKFPSSIAVDSEGKIYVLDKGLNTIQVFEPTRFIDLVHGAVSKYYNGDYDEAEAMWKQVLSIDANYDLAHIGIGKALFKQKQWKAAMDQYVAGDEKAGYSEAFGKYKHEVFRNNFGLIVVILIITVVLLVLLFSFLKKKADEYCDISVWDSGYADGAPAISLIPRRRDVAAMFRISLLAIFHPTDASRLIKAGRRSYNLFPSAVLLILVAVVSLLYIYVVHYPLADVLPRDANVALEISKLIVPILTLILASYAITTIMNGASTFKEICTAISYSMLPYILFTIPLAGLSHFMGQNDNTFYNGIRSLIFIWVVLLVFFNLMALNDYSFMGTAGISMLVLFGMLLICAITILFFTLTNHIIEFFKDVVVEYRMKFN